MSVLSKMHRATIAMSNHIGLAIFIVLLLGGCSAAPYQPSGFGGGYAETEVEPGIWRVSYWAAHFSTPETVQTYWLERAAELTLAKGYQGFEILSHINLASPPERQNARGVQLAAAGYIFIPVTPAPPPLELHADIRLLPAPIQPKVGKVFDASKLLTTLAPFVLGTKCNNGNVCAHYHRYLYEP